MVAFIALSLSAKELSCKALSKSQPSRGWPGSQTLRHWILWNEGRQLRCPVGHVSRYAAAWSPRLLHLRAPLEAGVNLHVWGQQHSGHHQHSNQHNKPCLESSSFEPKLQTVSIFCLLKEVFDSWLGSWVRICTCNLGGSYMTIDIAVLHTLHCTMMYRSTNLKDFWL